MNPDTILLIDDDREAATAIGAGLDGRSIRIRHRSGPAFDPAMLPGCSAVVMNEESLDDPAAAVRTITAGAAGIPLIVYSRRPKVESAVKMLKAGAMDYLGLTAGVPAICMAIAGLLDHSRSPSAAGRTGGPSPVEPLTRDEAMRRLLRQARQVASTDATVVIQGESGTGKEVLARYIHNCGNRAAGPFVAVNCAALPDQLAESELFGYEKGAFTGALRRRRGKFEQADGGTLLLDEISEMPLFMQAKLLRALQEKEIDRIGGFSPVPVDVRIIATTNRNLEEAVAGCRMRKDLYYRLKVIVFSLPPLSRRRRDIGLLASRFLETMNRRHRKEIKGFSEDALEKLQRYSWPGNVRELENAIERAVLLDRDCLLTSEDILLEGEEVLTTVPESGAGKTELKAGMTVEEAERALIMKTLEHVNQNRTRAARMLGISIRTLRNKINAYRNANPGQSNRVEKPVHGAGAGSW